GLAAFRGDGEQDAASTSRVALPPFMVGQLLWSVADVLCDAGEIELARKMWAELDVYAERVSDPYVRSWQMFTQGPRLSASGDLESVGRLGVDLETQADALGIPAWGRLVGVWLRASWTLHAGHAEEFLAQTGTFEALPNG